MTSQSQDRDDTIEQTVGNVVRIGRLWAVYGLEIGRAALRTSAETLKATSEILGTLAETIAAEKSDEREPANDDASDQPA